MSDSIAYLTRWAPMDEPYTYGYHRMSENGKWLVEVVRSYVGKWSVFVKTAHDGNYNVVAAPFAQFTLGRKAGMAYQRSVREIPYNRAMKLANIIVREAV